MGIETVGRRYANALFLLAGECGVMDAVRGDMEVIRGLFNQCAELEPMLMDPVIPSSSKDSVLEELFFLRITDMTGKFIRFLRQRKRLAVLRSVSKLFLDMEKEKRGIVEARWVVAEPQEAGLSQTLALGLGRRFCKTFVISMEVNPALMGGCQLIIRDRVYDYSIWNQLQMLKEKLKQ